MENPYPEYLSYPSGGVPLLHHKLPPVTTPTTITIMLIDLKFSPGDSFTFCASIIFIASNVLQDPWMCSLQLLIPYAKLP